MGWEGERDTSRGICRRSARTRQGMLSDTWEDGVGREWSGMGCGRSWEGVGLLCAWDAVLLHA